MRRRCEGAAIHGQDGEAAWVQKIQCAGNGSAKAHVRSAHAGSAGRLAWIANGTFRGGRTVQWIAVSQADLSRVERRVRRIGRCWLESESAPHYLVDREFGNRLPLLFIGVQE